MFSPLIAVFVVPVKQAQEWMGHSDIKLTADVYSQIVPSIQKRYLHSISNLFDEENKKDTVIALNEAKKNISSLYHP